MQCARRWFDDGDLNHLANLGKYVSAMAAAGARITYGRQPTPLWLAIVVITSTLATSYQLYWDFVKDWGVLNPISKNPWLRDDLILKKKRLYYAAIVLNFLLRLAWVEAVLNINSGMIDRRLLSLLLAFLEVVRRGQWNYFRLENEHLNNVGKFRAVKTVPLPFREMVDDDQDFPRSNIELFSEAVEAHDRFNLVVGIYRSSEDQDEKRRRPQEPAPSRIESRTCAGGSVILFRNAVGGGSSC
ncbi:unnamed protein product [Victoria cruziana]